MGGARIGSTPQIKLIGRQVSGDEQSAMTGILGRWQATRRTVVPDVVAATIARAETELPIIAVACPTAPSRSAKRRSSPDPGSSSRLHANSARRALVALVSATRPRNYTSADT